MTRLSRFYYALGVAVLFSENVPHYLYVGALVAFVAAVIFDKNSA